MAMSEGVPQTIENHARLIPLYHLVTFGILVINVLWRWYRMFTDFSGDTLVGALFAVGVVLIFFFARVFALTAQDRVIRLEMMLRLERVLPPDLRARAKELSLDQVIALRFAGDEELPELTRKVLAENLRDRKAIKKMIRNWQPDYVRV